MIRTTTGTGREVIDTGRVLIGLRVGEHRMPRAASDDETVMQDIVCGVRKDRMRFRDLVLVVVAVVCALVALALKFSVGV
jgi:hypothetical protein